MDANKIIDAFGGITKTAAIFETSKQAVIQWRENGFPKARIQYLRTLRPDLCHPQEVQQTTNPTELV